MATLLDNMPAPSPLRRSTGAPLPLGRKVPGKVPGLYESGDSTPMVNDPASANKPAVQKSRFTLVGSQPAAAAISGASTPSAVKPAPPPAPAPAQPATVAPAAPVASATPAAPTPAEPAAAPAAAPVAAAPKPAVTPGRLGIPEFKGPSFSLDAPAASTATPGASLVGQPGAATGLTKTAELTQPYKFDPKQPYTPTQIGADPAKRPARPKMNPSTPAFAAASSQPSPRRLY